MNVAKKMQGDLNQRRAVATGFRDDSEEQEVEELLKKNINYSWNVDGENSEQVSGETNHSSVSSVQSQRGKRQEH